MSPIDSDNRTETATLRVLVVAVILTLPDTEERGELSAIVAGPLPCTPPPSVRRAAASGPVHPTDWLRELLLPQLPGVDISTRLQALPPRFMPPDGLLLTVWATGRPAGRAIGQANPPNPPLTAALQALSIRLGDRSFAEDTAVAIRRGSSADPFLHRSLGEEVRLRALAAEDLVAPPGRDLPAPIGILPSAFSLGELQRAIAALVGRPAEELESGSNFRRRVQEFLHRGVLVEDTENPRLPDRERSGRPPRLYRFDPEAWQRWLLNRIATDLRSPDRPSAGDVRDRANSRWAATPHGFSRPAPPEGLRDPVRSARGDRLQSPDPETGERLSRIERMLEQLFRERDRAGPEL